MNIRVLMVGPGVGIVGGISSLVETIVPVLEKKVRLIYVSSVENRELKESGKLSLSNIFCALWQYTRFIDAFFRFRPNIIHLHTSQGLGLIKDLFYVIIAKIMYCKILVHVHAAEVQEFYDKYPLIVKALIRRVMSLSDSIIAVSEEWRNRLKRIIENKKITTFRNCIDVDSFPVKFEKDLNDNIKVIFIGSIGPRKGAFDLLKALSNTKMKNSSMQAWVIGYEERYGDMIQARVRSQKLGLENRCQLLGTVIGERKRDLLNKASVFVLPSYNEGLPVAVLEAMAAGLAIISTEVGGIPEVVKEGFNGFLIAPGDVDALADRLAFLENNPRRCRKMGENSRSIAERVLDVKPYVKRLVLFYESILKN